MKNILLLLLFTATALSAPLTDFEVQTQSGQLWVKLVEWRDAAVVVASKERDTAIAARAAAEAKFAAVLAKLKDGTATKEDVAAEADKTEKARERERIEKELADIDAQRAKKQAELDAIEAAKAKPALRPAPVALPKKK